MFGSGLSVSEATPPAAPQPVDREGPVRGGVPGLFRVAALAVAGIRTLGPAGGEAPVQLDGHSAAARGQQQPVDAARAAPGHGTAEAAQERRGSGRPR